MADIEFYEEDSDNPQDDGADDSLGLGIDDLDIDHYNPDEGLSPIQRLEKYIDTDNIFSRQMVARNLLDTMRQVGDNEEDACAILRAMVRLAEDPEATVRTELMEQVPHIALYSLENKHLFQDPIPVYLLPIIVKYLTDSNNQVRKTSQAALLVLLEQDLIHKDDIEEQVCPVIRQLSDAESIDDLRTEAVALMSKMAPLVGKDLTERMFLERFSLMCTDALFHVRKVCAANFGDMCSVVGQENTEKVLLPKFYYLCEDAVWGVRKACAECFMQVSCTCSLETRRSELAELFISLICDQSRWVRMSAFQGLGGFISTFADPSITGLYFSEDGLLVAGNPQEFLKKSVAQANQEGDSSRHNDQEDNDKKQPALVSQAEPVPKDTQSDPSCDSQAETPPSDSSSSSDCQPEPSGSGSCLEMMEIETGEESASRNFPPPKVEDPELSLEEQRAKKYYEQSSTGNGDQQVPTSSDNDNAESGLCHNDNSNANANSNLEECNSTNSTEVEKSRQCSKEEVSNNERTPVVDETAALRPEPCSVKEQQATGEASEETAGSGTLGKNKKNLRINLDSIESFNSFQYWREPLPEIEVDTVTAKREDGGDATAEAATGEANQEGEESSDQEPKIYTANVSTMCEVQEMVANIGSMHVLGQHVNQKTMEVVNGVVEAGPNTNNLSYALGEEGQVEGNNVDLNSSSSSIDYEQQDVIPQALLDHYLSMTDPSRAQTVDIEIARHCAYSLPAVAYTLGRKNWPFLRELYDTLAGDMQWKVRRTLAFSIHELAVIVGEDVTCDDLVPVFNGFIRDLDEVRIGVLKHLTDFLRLLRPDLRDEYLTQIADFLNTDNNRNWRFREELAQQLMCLLDLYTPVRISEYLFPVTLALAFDKVAEVRHAAFKVLSAMLKRLHNGDDQPLTMSFINDLIEKFARSNKWNYRQMFAQICAYILDEQATTQERFARDLLPSLLALGTDPVPNVRISLTQTIASHVMHSDYFTSAQNPHHEDLLATIKTLRSDSDRDVRYFLTVSPCTDISDPNSIPV